MHGLSIAKHTWEHHFTVVYLEVFKLSLPTKPFLNMKTWRHSQAWPDLKSEKLWTQGQSKVLSSWSAVLKEWSKNECQQPSKEIYSPHILEGGDKWLAYPDSWLYPHGHSTWILPFLTSTFSHSNSLQFLGPVRVGTACLNTRASAGVGRSFESWLFHTLLSQTGWCQMFS